jgi:hypothetical protein
MHTYNTLCMILQHKDWVMIEMVVFADFTIPLCLAASHQVDIDTYTKNIKSHKKRLNYYLSSCLKNGIQAGEFKKVPVKETTSILMIMINGVLRQGIKSRKKLMDAIVEFLHKNLVAK